MILIVESITHGLYGIESSTARSMCMDEISLSFSLKEKIRKTALLKAGCTVCVLQSDNRLALSVILGYARKDTKIHFSWSYLIYTFGFQGFSVACENPECMSATESSA